MAESAVDLPASLGPNTMWKSTSPAGNSKELSVKLPYRIRSRRLNRNSVLSSQKPRGKKWRHFGNKSRMVAVDRGFQRCILYG